MLYHVVLNTYISTISANTFVNYMHKYKIYKKKILVKNKTKTSWFQASYL